MKKGYTTIHLIMMIVLVFIIVFIFIFAFKFSKNKDSKEEFELVEKSSGIIINGDYLTYVNIGDRYTDAGASIYNKDGRIISNKMITTYYDGDEQVFSIDTRYVNNYVVKYQANGMTATRVVVICDRKAPKFEQMKTKILTDLEAATYDVSEGVVATDNSGKVDVNCENSLAILPGNYSIVCRASDPYGNVSTMKRLIKVKKGIEFNYDGNLRIKFPSGSGYVYKYSLDGGNSFVNCANEEMISVNGGSVIAAIYLDNELIMSNTYLIS